MITLVLGGTRSGKSAVAEELAARHGAPVTYVATMDPLGDPDLEARVANHRSRRDPAWATVEAGEDLSGLLADVRGTVLLDSLGPWVAAAGAGADGDSLCAALRAGRATRWWSLTRSAWRCTRRPSRGAISKTRSVR